MGLVDTTDIRPIYTTASQLAYGMVSYPRMVDKSGNIHCTFVYGRARLTPLKQQTIPRLELCAAVLAANADKLIRKELSSVLVLQYISNTHRRFHTFVANRIAAIHELSNAYQWRHSGTDLNPADDAT
ncbi:uncharacterized protein LOC121855834 [Homarus americanus]|uniref:uncharacterized protein LOC121855834 n=1 Tax=Homarus americanus TaxID=6706 RepID=UPI001C4660B3|nr:uncharacterized protein LOC121855834 [Homarus americanus]